MHPSRNIEAAAPPPFAGIESHLAARRAAIEAWFAEQWRQTPPPFYCSVDLRPAGFKLAPVDTNLFPAGLNNLPPTATAATAEAVREAITASAPSARRILLIPENHTRNRLYLENVATLQHILQAAGFTVRIGSLLPDLRADLVVAAAGGRLTLSPIRRAGDRLRAADLEPDLVLLNNDLSGGLPAVLRGLAQPVLPPSAMGWHRRRKSHHFAHYSELAQDFGRHVGLDPWRIDPLFRRCAGIDFHGHAGYDCLVEATAELLDAIASKYADYGIRNQPFVAIKADAGTYGMNVMMVRSPDQLRQLNRRQRNKMAVAKDGVPVREVLLQEGVPTGVDVGGAAEPVVCLVGSRVVGGFYRVHSAKGSDDNLNAPGMRVAPWPAGDDEAREYAAGVVARLAALAAAREIREIVR